jgi:Xaa-Pro aminopeptidase
MNTTAAWVAAQAAMAELDIDGVILSGVAAQEAIGGHRRIAVFQSDPPSPAFVLTRSGPPHVCTPDPEGALRLPADNVHPIAFDGSAFARALPAWLGSASNGRLALDRAAPSAHSLLAAACPDAMWLDAGALLERLDIGPIARNHAPVRDPDTIVDARRARVTAACNDIGADTWWCTTPEAIRMITGVRGPAAAAVVGDRLITDSSLDAAFEHLPARGRVAVDRITLADRARLLTARPELEIVDAGAIVLAGSTPRSGPELALLREGYRRTEYAIEATRHAFRCGRTERDCADSLARAGAQLDLEPHIDHVWTVIPRDSVSVPWLRGEWAGRAPWRQLTADRALGPGDLVALDAGFFFEGYVTDFGWTFAIDEPTTAGQSLARRWTDVADRVTAAIRPGANASDLRAAALDGWASAEPPWPFGLYVAHGVGFGGVVPPFAGTDLGVEVERTMVLQPGDVLMVEPYIFEDGVGGYRAERCVAVTETGADVWTSLPIEELQTLSPE